MVRTSRRRADDAVSPATKPKKPVGSKSLKTFLQKPKDQEPLFNPHWSRMGAEPEMSLDVLLQAHTNKPPRPCYKENCHDKHCEECMNNSCMCDESLSDATFNSSFTSHSMLNDENPKTKQKRRDRLEQMRADRELIAKMEMQNLALQNESKFTQKLNNSLNSFLKFGGGRQQQGGADSQSVGTAAKPAVEHPSSPFVRPKVAPGKFFKEGLLNKLAGIPLADDSQNESLSDEPDLPFVSRRHLVEEEEAPRVIEKRASKAPTLSIAEASFEVGGRKGTVPRQVRKKNRKGRGLSPSPKSSPLRKNSRARRTQQPPEIQW